MYTEQNEAPLNMQLNDLVASTPLGEFINSEDFITYHEERLNLYQLYLSDYVTSVYRTTRESEFKVVTCILLQSIIVYFLYCSWSTWQLIRWYGNLLPTVVSLTHSLLFTLHIIL